MLAIKLIIVIFMLFVPSLSDDPPKNFGTPEEFLKEVNEYRSKFAKEHKIPNMYKLMWSNELAVDIDFSHHDKIALTVESSHFSISSYRNSTGLLNAEIGKFKNESELLLIQDKRADPIQLINTAQAFIGCASPLQFFGNWRLNCLMGFGEFLKFWYDSAGEAGSRCPPRFKGQDGLCVPVDPSKYTFWGTEDQLLEDVNYMRRKYAKKYGIPNMHQLTWNESLVVILKALDLKQDGFGIIVVSYPASNDSAWDGFGKNWRITELPSFSAAVVAIEEAVHEKFVLNRKTERMIREKKESTTTEEMIHPLQTSIGCMKKEREENGKKYVLTACLLGNMGKWPSDWKIDANSTKIPGSECMDGYVNDDGLCVVAPPTTTPGPTTRTPEAHTLPKDGATEAVPAISKNPDASEEMEKEGASVEEDA